MPRPKAEMTPATRRRVTTIRRQLRNERRNRRIPQEGLARTLGVTGRSLRDWETGFDDPGLEHAMSWALSLGRRFTINDRRGQVDYAPAPIDALAWQMQDYQRMAVPLKARRRELKISQTDLGLVAGVVRSTLQRWEDGEQMPRLINLIAWADKLDFTLLLVPA